MLLDVVSWMLDVDCWMGEACVVGSGDLVRLGVYTYLAIAGLKVGQEGGEGALQHVRIAANGMRGVTIVRALAMET